MSSRRLRFGLMGVVALILVGAGAVIANDVLPDKLRTGETVTVGADEVLPHDLYATAGDIVVDGTIEGDLVGGGGTITINGTVQGDVVGGAGRMYINGDVWGDARVGAGWMTVDGSIGEDLVAGGGRITITESGAVGEDFFFGAGDVIIAGDVSGDVYGSASTYERTGSIGGAEHVTLNAGFELGELGVPGVPGEPESPTDEAVRVAGDAARHWIGVVLFGALGIWLLPRAVRASDGALRRRPLASAGMGIGILVGYVVQFIAVILLMILLAIALAAITLDSLAGVVIGAGILELLLSSFVLVFAAAFVVDAVVGLGLARLVARDWATTRWHELALLAAGSAFVVAVSSLPGVGPLAKLVVIVLGLGAMTVAATEAWQRRHPPAVPPFGAAAVAPPATPPSAPPPAPPVDTSPGV